MKHKAHAVALALPRRTMRHQQDGHPVERRRQLATDKDPAARNRDHNNDRYLPEERRALRDSQQAHPDKKPKDTLWLCLLGLVIMLYLLALMLILFG